MFDPVSSAYPLVETPNKLLVVDASYVLPSAKSNSNSLALKEFSKLKNANNMYEIKKYFILFSIINNSISYFFPNNY